MKNIHIELGHWSYTVKVKSGLLAEVPAILKHANQGQKWMIISQKRLMELFGFELLLQLKNNGFDADFLNIPVGEKAKSIAEYSQTINRMIKRGCDRSSMILALGGGVVGDVAGYIASSYMRGIRYYQIPTTLLSMVDSAIGGKTGINTTQGKNLIGSIYQPQAVFVDTDLLQTLPKEEIVSGLGEVIKYGAIHDPVFLNHLASWLDDLNTFPFEQAVHRACAIKAEFVTKDEKEIDARRQLNFGHTVGHAIEAHLGYGKVRHGEAVAYGMLCAAWISKQLGYLSNKEFEKLISIIRKLPLPTLPKMKPEHINHYIRNDKKMANGVLNYVVLNGLGNAMTVNHVDEKLIRQSLSMIQ